MVRGYIAATNSLRPETGRFAIRPCLLNVRTTVAHVEVFMNAVLGVGAERAREPSA